jgi:type IV pilus assembly protein PilE
MLKRLLNNKNFRYKKGFTLIELLVVLGILGILAAALLAAINPVEQLRKAQDASLEELASQYVSATARYYSTNNAYPWYTVANGGTLCNGATGTAPSNVALTNATFTACTTVFVNSGELKSSFNNATNLGSASISSPGGQAPTDTSSVAVCFQPQSHSVQANPNTKYTSTGGAGLNCLGTGGTSTTCYWCAE